MIKNKLQEDEKGKYINTTMGFDMIVFVLGTVI